MDRLTGVAFHLRVDARLNWDWERQWVLVCLGVVSIATVAMAAVLAVIDVADFAYDFNDEADLLAKFAKALVLQGAGFCYVAVIIRAAPAMFSTDMELAQSGLSRREAVARVYRLVFLEIILLGLMLFLIVAESFTATAMSTQEELDPPVPTSQPVIPVHRVRYRLASV